MKQLSLFERSEHSGRDRGYPYLHLTGDIPTDLPHDALISLQRTSPLKIYSLGFQPAKSIPEIPRWFLQKYGSKNFTVLEPFAGSGTTILESLRYGAGIDWLDYQPLSRLICQVKTTRFDLWEVREEALRILERATQYKVIPKTINFANQDFWFQKPVQEGLEILRTCILESCDVIQPILWVAFASTVRKTSDMNDGMILAAKRSKIEKIPQRCREDVFQYFQFYIDKALEAVGEWQSIWKPDMLERAREFPSKNALDLQSDRQFDAILTSPPYINAIDYVWAAKFELHWLGLVKSDKDRLNLYAQEIGTERIPKKECQELGVSENQQLNRLIEDIYFAKNYQASQGQNQLRARVVYQYFADMKTHFEQCFQLIKPGGYYCFAIGDSSKICGVEIPVASLLEDFAREVGFRQKFQFHLLLKNRKLNLPRNVSWAGTIKHDTVMVLEKAVHE